MNDALTISPYLRLTPRSEQEVRGQQVEKFPPVEVSLASTWAHLDKIALKLAHQTPCNLPPNDCPTCQDREWHESATRDAARDGE